MLQIKGDRPYNENITALNKYEERIQICQETEFHCITYQQI